MNNFLKNVKINEHSLRPKYRQLADAILDGLESGTIHKDDILPSLHSFCTTLDISKNSVEKAYNTLKHQGIVGSIPGKGYYVAKDKVF